MYIGGSQPIKQGHLAWEPHFPPFISIIIQCITIIIIIVIQCIITIIQCIIIIHCKMYIRGSQPIKQGHLEWEPHFSEDTHSSNSFLRSETNSLLRTTSRWKLYIGRRNMIWHYGGNFSLLNYNTGWPISCRTWVGLTLIWDVPPSCPAAQPVLPIFHQPRQNQAEGGTDKIKVNPTEVRQEMGHPVH